jgi:glutamate 5-kinase
MSALDTFAQSRRVVIKIGSALLVDAASGALNAAWLSAICEDIAKLSKEGKQVLLVSSGAIALGRGALGLATTSLSLPQKQACAAAGQTILTRAYADAMRPLGLTTAQALLTLGDTENRRRWLNARATLTTLLELGIIPIINENDTVATDEIRYGDNDRLAARTAQMISADSLILLSDIDGLYTQDPRTNPEAEHLPFIAEITPDVIAMGGGVNTAAGVGSGGMATKLVAAQIAAAAGCHMCVMDGTQPAPISRLRAGAKCTWFAAAEAPQNARRRWIGGTLDIKGTLSLDAGAVRALSRGKSLLAAGVSAVSGAFKKGDTVSLISPEGLEVARGLISYDAEETQAILGKNSAEISAVLGYDNGAALVHRDNLVVTGL